MTSGNCWYVLVKNRKVSQAGGVVANAWLYGTSRNLISTLLFPTSMLEMWRTTHLFALAAACLFSISASRSANPSSLQVSLAKMCSHAWRMRSLFHKSPIPSSFTRTIKQRAEYSLFRSLTGSTSIIPMSIASFTASLNLMPSGTTPSSPGGGETRCMMCEKDTDRMPSIFRILSPDLSRSVRVRITGRLPPTQTSFRYRPGSPCPCSPSSARSSSSRSSSLPLIPVLFAVIT
mmetsp:Transcript_26106/g.49354  ORF Transcript_26106/g.49354 Transcript_26106/m.49354 type:complete len:233 (-) Transcript_26106:2151-2849(-)